MKLNTTLAVVEVTFMPFCRVNQPFPSVPGPLHTHGKEPESQNVAALHPPPLMNCTLLTLWFTQTVVFPETATCRARLRIVRSSWAPPLSVAARQYERNVGTPTVVMIASTATTTSISVRLNPRLSSQRRRGRFTPNLPFRLSFEQGVCRLLNSAIHKEYTC